MRIQLEDSSYYYYYYYYFFFRIFDGNTFFRLMSFVQTVLAKYSNPNWFVDKMLQVQK